MLKRKIISRTGLAIALAGFVFLNLAILSPENGYAYDGPGSESDSTILARHMHELKVEWALEEFSDHSFNAHLTDQEIDSILDDRNVSIHHGQVVYAPDSSFKIVYVRGDECEVHCNPFWESWLHFNDGSGMVISHAGFSQVDKIEIMPDGKYLVWESGYSRFGAYNIEGIAVTLLSVDEHVLKYYPFPDTPTIMADTATDRKVSFSVSQANFMSNDLVLSFDHERERLNYQYTADVGMGFSGDDSVSVFSGYFQYDKGFFVHKEENTRQVKIMGE